jgi:Holliday junction resolvasome RuvABC endonuclease subunit
MSLVNLSKSKASRVMGIDCSTHSMAFTIFWNRRPIKWGKINFEGSDVFARIHDAGVKARAFAELEGIDVDFIVMESAIMAKVQNPDVTIKLAYVYGAVLSELMRTHTRVITVKPSEWQNFIGNKNFTKAEKEQLRKDFPGYAASWYTNKVRSLRKQRTMDYFNKKWPQMALDDNDVGDSCGIAYWGYYTQTVRGR